MNSPIGHDRNADQIAYWNGPDGQRWTDRQADAGHAAGAGHASLIDRAAGAPGERIIDVGCGCGGTTHRARADAWRRRAMCSASTSPGRCWRARGRSRPRGCRSISCWQMPPSIRSTPASFDLLVSRFGVMFFAEPAISFANLRQALRPSGRMAFACWREPRENPWMMAPLQAVYQARAEVAAAGPGRSRSLRLRVGRARPPHPRRSRLQGDRDGAGRALARYRDRARARGGGAGRLRSARRAARSMGIRRRRARRRDNRCARRSPVSARATTVPLPGSIWIVTARAS